MLEAYVFLLQLPYFLWLRNTWLLSEAGARWSCWPPPPHGVSCRVEIWLTVEE